MNPSTVEVRALEVLHEIADDAVLEVIKYHTEQGAFWVEDPWAEGVVALFAFGASIADDVPLVIVYIAARDFETII